MTNSPIIRFSALAYVRECGRQRRVVDLEEFAQRLWRRDDDEARKVKIADLADDVRSGVPVVEVWQRGDISGLIARQLAGAASYGNLYRILRDNGMAVRFRPADVAGSARDGDIPRVKVCEIFGIEDSEVDAFIAAWTASRGE